MSEKPSTGGGAATHAGTNYQNRVAAWIAVQILAEQDVTPPWSLPDTVTLEALHAEAPHPIDDLSVYTSAGGKALAQAKHAVDLGTTTASQLGGTIAQFVHEFCVPGQVFDATKDRFVLITSSQSSAAIRTDLPAFLSRMRTSFHPDEEWASGSADEQRAATVFRDHVNREWNTIQGTPPTTAELAAISRLVHIHILDVDQGGNGEHDAKNTLRQCIISDPTSATTAWNTLITANATYAANHQRANRAALQSSLTDASIHLQAQRSYRDDIQRLKTHATTTLHTLIEFSRIHVGNQHVTIQRTTAADTRTAAADSHLLIIGLPGAGKSGALYELAHTLQASGADVLVFAVDQFEAASTGALRNELGLTHELITILDGWPGTAPGYVIIDALDAARTEAAVQTLQAIMEQVISRNNRWHVIASVRKYDLRYNKTLQRLFQGTPPGNHTDNEFPATRHVNIPTLSPQERQQVGEQHPALAAVVATAPAALQELLRLPFNLRLLAELLNAGTQPDELHPIKTQADLLDRYWQERIIRHDAHGDARELVLQRTTDAMVQQRALRIPRTAARANDTASSTHLKDLLSTHVLAEWTTRAGTTQRDFLTFPHHLLFDYAVARLSIPQEPKDLIARLTQEADLLIAIRPSMELHYQRLWHHDAERFWELTFNTITTSIPEVGKLLGPSIAALSATTNNQFCPLLNQLQQPDAAHNTGMAVLRHLFATLLTNADASDITGSLWCDLLDAVSAPMTRELAFAVQPSLWFLTERVTTLSKNGQSSLGRVARRLLNYALAIAPNDQGLLRTGIAAVNKTATTDTVESVHLLRDCITPEHLQRDGYRTLHVLAEGVPILASSDPSYVTDLYLEALRNKDASTGTTTMYESQIMPFTSNRRQDYNQGLWCLGEHCHEFLRQAPAHAIRTLLIALQEDPHLRSHKQLVLRVRFDDAQTGLIPDNSDTWDNGVYDDELPVKMLDALQAYLVEQAGQPNDLTNVLQLLTSEPVPAVVWRRLLLAGTHQPTTLGYTLRSLAWDHNILTSPDTTRPAGNFLRAIHATLTNDDRERIENAILSVATSITPAHVGAHYRDRLLGCLSSSQLVTTTAHDEYQRITAGGGPPSNAEDRGAHWGTLHPAPSTHSEPLLSLLRPVTGFVEQHLNTSPTTEAINGVLPHLHALDAAIARPEDDALTPAFVNEALSELARACVAIAHNDQLTNDQLAQLLPILREGANDPDPEPNEEQDQTHKITSWGTRSPRIQSAEAIILLARYESWCTPEMKAIIPRLGADPVPVVRLQIASRLTCLYTTVPELMWELMERYAHDESNPTVILDTLHNLHRLPAKDASKTASLTISIFERTASIPDNDELRSGCINILAGLALWAKDTESAALINTLITDPMTHARDVHHLILCVAGGLPAREQRVTDAAFALLDRALTSVMQALRSLEAAHQDHKAPPTAQEQHDLLMRCADELAMRLYLSSGAFQNPNNERVVLASEEFYRQAKPLLVMLADIGHPHTAHSLLEALEHFIAVDPPGVLRLVADVVRTGSKYGYQYEQLAMDLLVKIIERYLAQYRPILRDDAECSRALMDTLDVFVRVGWPSAHRLAYRLNEIYA